MLTPHPYQAADIESFLAEPTQAGLNATGVGGGKTLVATEIARRLDAKQTVVVAPINTLDGWNRHMMMQRDIPVRRCGGSNKAQKAAMVDMISGQPGVFMMSWEYMRSIGDFSTVHPDFVIMDEVHRAQNRKSRQALAYHSISKGLFAPGGNPDARIIALSGTPAGNHMTGLWSVCRGLWPEQYIRKNEGGADGALCYWPWTAKYFKKEWNDYAGYAVPTTEKVPGQITRDLSQDFYYVRHEQGVRCCGFHPEGMQADLPKRVFHDVTVELSAPQRKLYKQMEKDMIAWMNDHDWPIESGGLPMIQHMRLLQICLGTPTTEMLTSISEEGDIDQALKVVFPLDTKSTKIDAVIDILEDAPDNEPFIVWTHSTALIPALVTQINLRFKDRHRAVRWDGTVSHRQRAEIKDSFGHGGPNIIVAQIAALAEGVDGLQYVCSNEVWVSMSANLMENTQALGRLDRPGQTRAVNSWRIIAEGTVEEPKLERLDVKSGWLVSGLHA